MPVPTVVIRGGPGRRRHGRAPRRRARRATASSPPIGRDDRGRRPTACSTPAVACVAPGLVDLHTHLREPGGEEAETIETGSRARRARRVHRGGRDAEHDAGHRRRRGRRDGAARSAHGACATSRSSGCITDGRAGEQLAPMGEMAALGVRHLHRRRHRRRRTPASCAAPSSTRGAARRRSSPQHCEDDELAGGGHMHEGAWSSRLGIPGQPARGRGRDGGARHRARARSTGAPRALPPPVDGRRRSRWCAPRRPRACR